jgi:hypothetical protein
MSRDMSDTSPETYVVNPDTSSGTNSAQRTAADRYRRSRVTGPKQRSELAKIKQASARSFERAKQVWREVRWRHAKL